MNGKKINSDRAPAAVGLYPHARKVGNMLYLSGVGPRQVGKNRYSWGKFKFKRRG